MIYTLHPADIDSVTVADMIRFIKDLTDSYGQLLNNNNNNNITSIIIGTTTKDPMLLEVISWDG